jgi:Ca2+-transporting ATPase
MFVEQFESPLVLILLAAAAISFSLSAEISFSPFSASVKSFTEVLDAAAIMAIVILNAAFGFVQERNAEKAIDALKKMMAPTATVLRDGQKQKVDAKALVAGDLLLLEEGDRVPADCRILEAKALEVDESALTGESVPMQKDAETIKDELPLAERRNMAFMSTVVTRGRARAVATATGMRTEIGRISELVESSEEGPTPLQVKLKDMAKTLGILAIATSVLVFLLGISRGQQLYEMFMTTVSIAVAAIPEGLPAIVTLTLAFGVQRMAKRNAIIRKLPACETLGSATVVCTDKTGTVTKNEMTVKTVFAGGTQYDVSGTGYSALGAITPAKWEGGEQAKNSLEKNEAFRMAVTCAVACNNAKLVPKADPREFGVIGDPMEAALLVLGRKAGLDRDSLELEYLFEDENLFDSGRRMMSTLWRKRDGGYLFAKGAPETILSKSTHYMDGGGNVHPLDKEGAQRILAVNKRFASEALRVLGFAFKRTEAKTADYSLEAGLVFVGLAGLYDPPREEIPGAIDVCRQAGIRVIMITGDNADTAIAIARQVGLAGPNDLAVSGRELDAMSEKELLENVQRIAVYARVEPQHKIRIVGALKARGETVAMTGDGVNDAPALKKADIGIAMGLSGTDVAKESSDMVLADDNFASIVSAVEEGRVIYDNIVKSVRYLVSCNMGEVAVILLSLLAGFAHLPLLPLQILWMNLVTDGLPALALGSDTPSQDIMKKKPRGKGEEILGYSVMPALLFDAAIMACGTLGIFLWALESGSSVREAQTNAFSAIIFFQLFHSFNMRSLSESVVNVRVFENRKLLLAFVFGLAIQLAIIFLPVLQDVFKTAPLALANLALLLSVSFIIVPAVELRKALMRKGRISI